MLNVRCSNITSKITHHTFQFEHQTSDFELFLDADTDSDTDPEAGVRGYRSEGPPLPSQTGLQPRGETPDRRCGDGTLGQGTPQNERVPKVRPGFFDPVEDGEGVWGKRHLKKYRTLKG